MKKVLFIQQELQGGGAEKLLIDVLNNFDYSRYKVTLLIIFKEGVYLDQINKNVEVIYLFDKVDFFLKVFAKLGLFSFRNFYLSLRLNKLFKGLQYDTIVSFLEGYSCICHDFLITKGKRNISWVHTNLIENNWCKNDFKSLDEQSRIYKEMDDIVFVSKGAKYAFNKLFNETRQSVVTNLIDSKKINELAEKDIEKVTKTRFTVCTVGRLIEEKKHERIIEIARRLKEKNIDIEFWIIGIGPKEKVLKQSVLEYGLEDIIIFKGFQHNPYSYIKAADVFLLTSQTEGYPLVVCEALCLGKPVISTNVTGVDEILRDNSGILCGFDISELSNAVESLYMRPNKLKEYSKRAKQQSTIFSVERKMEEMYQIIEGRDAIKQ